MSDSASGILAYGYDLGGDNDWKLEGASEYGEYNFPWLVEDYSWQESAERILLSKIVKFDEKWEDVWRTSAQDWFHKRLADAMKKLRVEIVRYGTYNDDRYILATKAFTADDYDCMVVELATDHAAAGILDVALAALDIVPTQQEPKWILASFYG